MRRLQTAYLAAGLMLCVSAPSFAQDQVSEGKKIVTTQCSSCHSIQPGKNGAGPSLAGVFGRHAGSLGGFNYSPALKNSGIVWNDQTLDVWLTNPLKDVPGAHMYFPGTSDAAKRQAIIAYLKTI